MEVINSNRGSGHAGPNPGVVATVYGLLLVSALCPALTFADGPHLPAPWESETAIATYFQDHLWAARICAFFQFGSSIPLGIFTATMVSRLQFLGIRAAGAHIALFGGLAAAFSVAASALVLWVITCPGITQETAIIHALYYLMFACGSVGFSVPMGLLIAGLCIPAASLKALPTWLVFFGLVVAITGELSAFNLLIPQALFLVPLTRFASLVWLISAGFMLPKT
jgi:hypothetical protein